MTLALRALRKHGIAAGVDDVVASGTGPHDGRNANPGFVLLDVKLPKLDGHQVLERLRDDRTHLVPDLLSSSSEHKDVIRGCELGANSHVTRPANPDQFSEAMRYLGWYRLNFNETPQGARCASRRR